MGESLMDEEQVWLFTKEMERFQEDAEKRIRKAALKRVEAEAEQAREGGVALRGGVGQNNSGVGSAAG